VLEYLVLSRRLEQYFLSHKHVSFSSALLLSFHQLGAAERSSTSVLHTAWPLGTRNLIITVILPEYSNLTQNKSVMLRKLSTRFFPCSPEPHFDMGSSPLADYMDVSPADVIRWTWDTTGDPIRPCLESSIVSRHKA